jgi:hypothetical protein
MPSSRLPAVLLRSLAVAACLVPCRLLAQDADEHLLHGMTSPPHSGYALIRETQKELHRVGCYAGEMSGVWTVSSRHAAQKFIDRVNARLPIDPPDQALLALLRSETGPVCGECPAGQGLDAAGRCLPTALLRKPQPKSIQTGSLPDAPRQEASPPEKPGQREGTPASKPEATPSGQRAPSKPSYWSKLLSTVDQALGLGGKL